MTGAHVRLTDRLSEYVRAEASGGIVMLAAACAALFCANSPLSGWYEKFVGTPVIFGFSVYRYEAPLEVWTKEALMVLFFFVVGMELKREMHMGFLTGNRKIAFPVIAALCGMAVPALVYLTVTHDSPAYWKGWAISSATDTAFALGALALLCRGMPAALKAFLLAVAIFDDLGAVTVIAVFYSSTLAVKPLLLALAGLGALYLINRLKVMYIPFYLLLGAYMWFCLYSGGVHTTVAGGIAGFFMPVRDEKNNGFSPLLACLRFMHPWVTFVVLPFFAFTCVGISFSRLQIRDMLENPLFLGIVAGLCIGKQLGIFLGCYLSDITGLSPKPAEMRWGHIYGCSLLAGIGFTMSLMIGFMAFEDTAMRDLVRSGVLAGSLISLAAGCAVLRLVPGGSWNKCAAGTREHASGGS